MSYQNVVSMREKDGSLPAFAWPGGYPIFYITRDSGVLCADCANQRNGSLATTDEDAEDQWRIVASDINWEIPDLMCDHCGRRIESAYAEDDAAK